MTSVEFARVSDMIDRGELIVEDTHLLIKRPHHPSKNVPLAGQP